MKKQTLDSIEKQDYIFKNTKTPISVNMNLDAVNETAPSCAPVFSLDGEWEMIEGTSATHILSEWENAIKVKVPGSIHKALMDNGLIPDPRFGKNDVFAREQSRKGWWLSKEFDVDPEDFKDTVLRFGGICAECSVWLNGQFLGTHNGMFGGPDFDISGKLEKHNVLRVQIQRILRRDLEADELSLFWQIHDVAWIDTVVFNCVYGWHYAYVPAQGIWQHVWLEKKENIEITDPFIKTVKADTGSMNLEFGIRGPEGGYSGKVHILVRPLNFSGESYSHELDISSSGSSLDYSCSFDIPDPKLWWPNGYGNPNLYTLTLYFEDDKKKYNAQSVQFGIRTIEMKTLPEGEDPQKYEWIFCVNGKDMFIKGANWCTLDFLMDFSHEKYDRFLTLAKNQHITLLRAWGAGMVETDDFYDLCDKYGIMVLQEWPTAWDSHKVQPQDALFETLHRNILRLRNRPSLIMWGAGNESPDPTDAVIIEMGRMTYKMDGTRPFHRGEPWGGSIHDYHVYWGREDVDTNLKLQGSFIGEFGVACSPNIESVERYLPDEEKGVWPPVSGGAFEHHTPVFNTKDDMEILTKYANDFSANGSMQDFVFGTQISQAIGVRHTLELARTRWPECAGVCYYKLTDVFPAASWSTVDYYGVPKMGYFFIADSYEPLCPIVLFDTFKMENKAACLPVHIVDDANALGAEVEWTLRIKVYDGKMSLVKEQTFTGKGTGACNIPVGEVNLTAEETNTWPLFIVADLERDGYETIRNYYWSNFFGHPDWITGLPKAKLSWAVENGILEVTNTGTVPAVGVHALCADISDKVLLSDNYFWLEAGETKKITLSQSNISGVGCWNS